MTDPSTAPTPETARAEIASLRNGSDPAFATAFSTPMHPGHRAAVARMDTLHAAAFGTPDAGDAAPALDGSQGVGGVGQQEAEAPAGDDVDVAAYGDVGLSTIGDMTPIEAVRAVGEVRQLVATLALPPDLARGGVAMLERDIAARDGRPMDGLELATFETALRRQAGADYDRVCDALETAVQRAGKRGEVLRRALASASPTTAAWAAMSIFNSGKQEGAR